MLKSSAHVVIAVAVLSMSFFFPTGSQRVDAAFNVAFTNFWVSGVSPGSGYIGVDIWWPGGGSEYNPCHHSNDMFYGSCILSNNNTASYYKVMNYTPSGTDFPYGIFIDNQNPNYCKTSNWCTNKPANSFTHGWGNLISDGSLEIYPTIGGVYNPSANTVGGVRIKSDFFLFANGGRYSKDIGTINLPQIGNPGVGRLNGFATYNGVRVANGRMQLDIFQRESTSRTSSGHEMYGFSSIKNNGDAYYNSGALPSGTYKIYVTDLNNGHKVILDGVSILEQHERLDFKLDQHCFGFASIPCTDPAN